MNKGSFKKGLIPWNKGIPATEEQRIKISCTKILKIIKREEFIHNWKRYKIRNRNNQYLYPYKYNEDVILDIRL